LYEGSFDGTSRIAETVTVTGDGVKVEDVVTGPKEFRVCYPMLVFDGLEQTRINVTGNTATLSLRDGAIRFELAQPSGIEINRSGRKLDFRNGEAELLYADVSGTSATYFIRPAKSTATAATIPSQ
jgi:hypothetical protein